MSMQKSCALTCPRCGANSTFSVFYSVTENLSPVAADQLREGKLNMIACPSCELEVAYIPEGFIYHSIESNLMVVYLPQRDEVLPEIDLDLPPLAASKYRFSAVDDLESLREEAIAIKRGLDYRVLAVMKMAYRWQGESASAGYGSIRFCFDEDEILVFGVCNDGETKYFSYPRSAYDEIVRRVFKMFSDELGGPPRWRRYDEAWASQAFLKLNALAHDDDTRRKLGIDEDREDPLASVAGERPALVAAAFAGDEDRVKRLLTRVKDIDRDISGEGHTALGLMLQYGTTPAILRMMVDAGAGLYFPRKKNGLLSPLLLADPLMLSRNRDICAMLIDFATAAAVPREAFGEMLVSIAAHGDDPMVVEVLLAAGADIEYRDREWGQTALFMSAVNGGTVLMTKALLEKGADAEATMKGGDRPLVAVARSYAKALPSRAPALYAQAKALLEGGADPSGPGAGDLRPLDALGGEDSEGLRRLLEAYLFRNP